VWKAKRKDTAAMIETIAKVFGMSKKSVPKVPIRGPRIKPIALNAVTMLTE
jgi:hypothetical protein